MQWQVPPHIIVFIANSLEEGSLGRVLPWPEFKSLIYEIYDFRIYHAFELNGAINTNYISLEEYLLVYFLEKHKLRRLAEIKLIELLTSLKYYQDIWIRARTFAILTNILISNDSYGQSLTSPNKSSPNINELSIPQHDIYLQEFYLQAYSIILRERESLLESKEGNTFVKVVVEEASTPFLMFWFTEQDQRKWFHKVRRNVKKMKTTSLDEFESEYIDVDLLLHMYLEEFKAKKKANQKALTKAFMKIHPEVEGVYSTEEIDKIVTHCLPSTSLSAFV
mmetsp:Transcript_16847/g.16097  ORF Transcript_16847/g.16097 Transcript_16847/m.16097 type:complete len:279 (+) Transcript_16847:1881-2717(+)|eukprot:CAMPEP_0170551364 /NCGR_PEP_ID=MMETSP0211-20121228/9366_1 /TAXON_ID=311385 /ORGANISM="Pseudokeronopsis sp., Strain OXSARD2" /LENGTH=278 /DNA_ID=CAMNT_0010858475 /DNA_START=1830 /DNA_END=2666 /DNA_ORIENTATION=+